MFATFCLSSTGRLLGCVHPLAIVNSTAMNIVCEYVLERLLSFPLHNFKNAVGSV
jgi:hypothetical protein